MANVVLFLMGIILSGFITSSIPFMMPPPSLSGWLAGIGQFIFSLYCAHRWGWRNKRFISK
jgi:hypothetical protein